MDYQNILVYIIVGVAVLYTARSLVRQFASREGACPKCAQCGHASAGAPQPESLTQIETAKDN